MEDEFQPGASKHGNFINYYQFNSTKNRLQLLPVSLLNDLFPNGKIDPLMVIDVGCNTGELTEAVIEYISTNAFEVKALACDLDPTLILRAEENSKNKNVTYKCLNIMDEATKRFLKNYLKEFHKTTFDIGFCFAVTMWIHLNYGDGGLRTFLHHISSLVKHLVLEPQPWQCYRSAARRLKRLKQDEFPKFKSLVYRSNVVDYIDDVLIKEMNMVRQDLPGKTDWGRSIILYSHKNHDQTT